MNISTLERFDPNLPRSFTPIIIAGYIVTRQRLQGTHYTRYCIMVDGTQARTQISYPSPQDCQDAARWCRAEKASQERCVSRAPKPIQAEPATGTLTERAVAALRAEKMGLGKLAQKLNANPDGLAPILTRLVNQGRIARRGVRGKYVFEAA